VEKNYLVMNSEKKLIVGGWYQIFRGIFGTFLKFERVLSFSVNERLLKNLQYENINLLKRKLNFH
jgi:hypothetical protein